MAEHCVFCDVVDGDEPAHIVSEGEETVAFLDANPAVEGHALVVPRTHVEGLTDLDHSTTASLFRTVRDVAAAAERAFDADGVSVFQSSGEAAGQDVFHVHVHVLPRYEDDDVRFAPPRRSLRSDEGRAVADRLRSALSEQE